VMRTSCKYPANNSLQLTGPAAEKRLTESEFGWPGS